MASITRLTYRDLRREEQHSFNRRVMRIIEETYGADTKHYVEFRANAEKFAELLSDKGVAESTSLAELDKAADNAWSALYFQIQASMRHPHEDVRTAARVVNEVFEKIKNPVQLNYDQEYGALQTLLDMLSKLDGSTLAAARVGEFVEHLAQCVANFIEASNAVEDIKSKRTVGALKEAATGCSNSWSALCKFIEAMAELDNPDAIHAVRRLDTMTTAIKTRLRLRKSTKDAGNVVEEISDDTEKTFG